MNNRILRATPKRTPRMYAICYKQGDGVKHWLSRNSLPLAQARTHWQGMLLSGSFAGYSMYLEPAPKAWVVDAAERDAFMRRCGSGRAEEGTRA